MRIDIFNMHIDL